MRPDEPGYRPTTADWRLTKDNCTQRVPWSGETDAHRGPVDADRNAPGSGDCGDSWAGRCHADQSGHAGRADEVAAGTGFVRVAGPAAGHDRGDGGSAGPGSRTRRPDRE